MPTGGGLADHAAMWKAATEADKAAAEADNGDQQEEQARAELDRPTDRYVPFYAKWNKDLQARRSVSVPSLEVLAGHAHKHSDRVHAGDLRAFEMAHGIPSGTLEATRSGGIIDEIKVADGKEWKPENWVPPKNLDPKTVRVFAFINTRQADSDKAYRQWKRLPSHLRPFPNGKVLIGFVNENRRDRPRIDKVQNLKSENLDDFLQTYSEFKGQLTLVKNTHRHVTAVVPSQPGQILPYGYGEEVRNPQSGQILPDGYGEEVSHPLDRPASSMLPGGGRGGAPSRRPPAATRGGLPPGTLTKPPGHGRPGPGGGGGK